MQSFDTNEALLAELEETGCEYEVCGRTPFGQPIVVSETGGGVEPGVFVTAGAHATEQAGVSAAVTLLRSLETERRVAVVPTRDPIGLNGYEYALGQCLDRDVRLDSFADLERLLDDEGDVTYREGDLRLALIGDVGFGTKRPDPDGESSQLFLLKRLKALQHDDPSVLEPYRGRRIIVPAGQSNIPGSGRFERAYTLVVSPDGQLLHLNRFFDAEWAPPETRSVRHVLADVRPQITFDLHETQLIGDRVYIGIDDPSDERARFVGRAMKEALSAAGAQFATAEDVARVGNIVTSTPATDPADQSLTMAHVEDGVYGLADANEKGEGLNANEFASQKYGLAVGTETGMTGSFEDRVRFLVTIVRAGVEAIETFD